MMIEAMATQAQQKWKHTQQIQGQLQLLLKKNGKDAPTYEELDHLMTQLRIACEATIFLDFEYATEQGVGRHLWEAHTSINSRYRKLLDQYRKGDQKKLVVERRKLEKRYVDFIKTSQHFYKGYIQRLASHFDGMKGLLRIAHRLSLSTLSVDQRVKVSPHVEHLIELSCHATLLRLGDLSRYRNQLRTKDRSWDPALGYYCLANDLYPDSGNAHNQMAVIALTDGNHLDAVYHLYRAITTNEPHTLSQGNLELEFKKIVSAWEKKRSQPKTDSLTTLIWWFVLLHAKFYDGIEFSTHKELENEVLSRLALLLKEQSFGDTMEKFVLISIAAEFLASQRVREKGEDASDEIIQSFYFCLEFNIRMMSVLLQVLLPELEDSTNGEDIPKGADGSPTTQPREKITAIARRVLPALRQYSVWLASGTALAVPTTGSVTMNNHMKEMWKLYADVLTRLANFFPVQDLAAVNYLLEEDSSTVGFQPFREPQLATECDFYIDGQGSLKPRITDAGIKRHHPNIEMQSRVRDILLYGLSLQLRDDIPVKLDHNDSGVPVFTFVESGPQINRPVQLQPHAPAFTSPSSNVVRGLGIHQITAHSIQNIPDESVAGSDSQAMDSVMHRMVDSLLEPPSSTRSTNNETSYGMHSITANEVFAPITSKPFEPRLQSTPKMLPSLPDFYNSAFTPQPNELQPSSPIRPTTARQLSPLSLSTKEHRLTAAATLDEVTGYNKTNRDSWGRNPSRPLSDSSSQPVNQILQESLAQQFMPMSSSAFLDSSSLYANSPQGRNWLGGGGNTFTSAGDKNSNMHGGVSDFDKATMLQSSLWNGTEPSWGGYVQTPPGAQGG